MGKQPAVPVNAMGIQDQGDARVSMKSQAQGLRRLPGEGFSMLLAMRFFRRIDTYQAHRLSVLQLERVAVHDRFHECVSVDTVRTASWHCACW